MENTPQALPQQNSQLPYSGKSAKRRTVKIVAAVLVSFVVIGILFYFKSLLIAATVDGSPITRLSLINRLEKQSGKSTLDSLITEKLIENEAAKKGIVVSDDEVNQEIKNIEANIVAQGGTFKDALAQKGLTEEVLRSQIKIQKKVEKLLANKIQVTEEEINKFISDSKISVPKEKSAEIKKQAEDQLRNQKLGQEAQQWITMLKAQAKITYYINF